MGVLESVRRSDNSTGVRLVAKGADGNFSTSLGVYRKANGTVYTSAPTPTAGDNSTNIATTAFVKTTVSNTLSTLYPVGSIYIGTQSTCPLATLINGSTWVKVSEGRVLQGSDSSHNAGTTIEAGLPNITGSAYDVIFGGRTVGTGALIDTNRRGAQNLQDGQGTSSWGTIFFDAQDSNSIYGNSSTVQPPAYVVNIWRRTA